MRKVLSVYIIVYFYSVFVYAIPVRPREGKNK